MKTVAAEHRALVLLASYNGVRFISAQIHSILGQYNVEANILISDDGSSDGTFRCIAELSSLYPGRISLLHACRVPELSYRNSANNFYHLISSVILDNDFKWVALSDQDDIWDPVHLCRAIELLNRSGSAGYSSSVLAFWPDGRRRLVRKDGNISRYNHLFEAPGPGCSFVLPCHSFLDFQSRLSENLALAARVDFHDWAIYAFIRAGGGSWLIDSWPSLMYRQHDLNVLGVQLTSRSISRRLTMLMGGWYRDQCLAVASFSGQLMAEPISRLRRFSFSDRLALAWIVFVSRRRLRDRLLLPFSFLFMSALPSVSRE